MNNIELVVVGVPKVFPSNKLSTETLLLPSTALIAPTPLSLSSDQSLVLLHSLDAWCQWCLDFAFFVLQWTASGINITTVLNATKRLVILRNRIPVLWWIHRSGRRRALHWLDTSGMIFYVTSIIWTHQIVTFSLFLFKFLKN